MKKIIIINSLILLGLILIPTNSTAQEFAIGPKVGFNATNFRGSEINREEFRKGYQVGLFFTYTPKEWFVLHPEIVFDQRGSNQVIYNTVNREILINYLTIPISLDFRIPILETFYPKVMLGPYTSFKINDKQRIIGNTSVPDFAEADIARVDVGGFAGAGLDIQSEKIYFSFDIRYLFGAIDLNHNSSVEFRNTQISTNAAIGVRF